MPKVAQRHAYDGAEERIRRLGLGPLYDEVIAILTGFRLQVSERPNANSAAAILALIDEQFSRAGGWRHGDPGDIHWGKCYEEGDARVCLAVKVQLSARR